MYVPVSLLISIVIVKKNTITTFLFNNKNNTHEYSYSVIFISSLHAQRRYDLIASTFLLVTNMLNQTEKVHDFTKFNEQILLKNHE